MRFKYSAGLLFRESSPDRPLLSANDWWGLGYLAGAGAPLARAGEYLRWYCGQKGAHEQYKHGMRTALHEL